MNLDIRYQTPEECIDEAYSIQKTATEIAIEGGRNLPNRDDYNSAEHAHTIVSSMLAFNYAKILGLMDQK